MLHDCEFCFAGLIIILPRRRLGHVPPISWNSNALRLPIWCLKLEQKCAVVANGLSLVHQMILYFFTRTLATNLSSSCSTSWWSEPYHSDKRAPYLAVSTTDLGTTRRKQCSYQLLQHYILCVDQQLLRAADLDASILYRNSRSHTAHSSNDLYCVHPSWEWCWSGSWTNRTLHLWEYQWG